jgi:hypothetical protein
MRHQLIAMLILTSCATARATALPPDIKTTLLKGTNDSCLENQVKDASNKAMTVGQLWTYCDCYAKAFTAIMTVESLEENKDALTPETLKKAGEFSKQCAASTLRK